MVVSQRAKLLEIVNEYAIHDQSGVQIGAVRQVGQSAAKKAMRVLTSFDQFLTHRLEVVDLQGTVLLVLIRPAKVMKSKILVQDAQGAEIGQIVQSNVFGKIRFSLEAGGHVYGAINAENWRAWNFHIADHTGTEVARITKTWEGLVNTIFTTADNFVVQIHRPARGAPPLPGRRQQPRHRHRPEAGQPRLQLVGPLGPGRLGRGRGRSLPAGRALGGRRWRWRRTSRRSATSRRRCCRRAPRPWRPSCRGARRAGRHGLRDRDVRPARPRRWRSAGWRPTATSSPRTSVIGTVSGPLASILTAERTALNFLGHLSGIATLTRRFVGRRRAGRVARASGTPARRRRACARSRRRPCGPAAAPTTAATCRTGSCSRTTTSRSWASPRRSPSARRRGRRRTVHVECDRLDQLEQALEAGADAVLLDNMTPDEVTRVRRAGRRPRRVHRSAAARCSRCRGGITARDRRRLRRPRRRHDLGRRPSPTRRPCSTSGSTSADRGYRFDPSAGTPEASGDAVLLAIDAGNTDTVVGLYDLDALRRRRRSAPGPRTACRPLAHRHRGRPHRRRARPCCCRASSASAASPSTTSTAWPCRRACPGSRRPAPAGRPLPRLRPGR